MFSPDLQPQVIDDLSPEFCAVLVLLGFQEHPGATDPAEGFLFLEYQLIAVDPGIFCSARLNWSKKGPPERKKCTSRARHCRDRFVCLLLEPTFLPLKPTCLSVEPPCSRLKWLNPMLWNSRTCCYMLFNQTNVCWWKPHLCSCTAKCSWLPVTVQYILFAGETHMFFLFVVCVCMYNSVYTL